MRGFRAFYFSTAALGQPCFFLLILYSLPVVRLHQDPRQGSLGGTRRCPGGLRGWEAPRRLIGGQVSCVSPWPFLVLLLGCSIGVCSHAAMLGRLRSFWKCCEHSRQRRMLEGAKERDWFLLLLSREVVLGQACVSGLFTLFHIPAAVRGCW